MKYAKTLGLAIGAAAVLMALVGTGTASATVLCKNNESVTSCNEPYEAGTEFASSLASGTNMKLKTEFKTLECSKSALSGKTESAGSETETVKGPVEALTFEECNCEVKVLKKGALEIHWISGGTTGTVTETGAELTVSCSTIFGTVHCIYATENTDLGTLTGGNPAKLDVNASLPKLTTSFLCSEAMWEASWEFTSPSPLYVTQAKIPTKLCRIESAGCAAEDTYPRFTTFQGSSAAGELIMNYTPITVIQCEQNLLSGETGREEGAPLPVTGTASLANCAFTVPKQGGCEVTINFGNPQGLTALKDKKNGSWTFGNTTIKVFNCGNKALPACTFQNAGPAVEIQGGKEKTAKLVVDRTFTVEAGGSKECPPSLTWKGVYVIGLGKEGVKTLFVTN